MQLSPQDRQLFESLARNSPRLRQWLAAELVKQQEILVQAVDDLQMRRAQGNALRLQQMIDLLDVHLTSR